MKFIHYYTGITLSVFIGIHILNHLFILRSELAHINFMNVARRFYRNRVIESILLFAVALQIITGISLVILKWNKAGNFFDWTHIISGLYLSIFLVIHVSAVLKGRKNKIETNLYYGAGVMNMRPHKLVFIPYYTLSLLSFFFHIASIHRNKMEVYTSRSMAELQAYIIMITGIVLTAAIIIPMSNLGKNAQSKITRENQVQEPAKAVNSILE